MAFLKCQLMYFYFFSKWHFNYATLKVTKQWSDGATGIMYHLVTNVLLLDRCRLKAGQTPTGVDAVCAHLFMSRFKCSPDNTHTHSAQSENTECKLQHVGQYIAKYRTQYISVGV